MPGGLVDVTGGVGFSGGVRIGIPSPPGQWSPQWKDQKVDFDRDEFARFIADKGYEICWEKALPCPNIPRPDADASLAPRDHVIGCPMCGGNGYVYVDPLKTSMLMQGMRFTDGFYAYSQWYSGTSLVTAMPEYTINYFDRLTLCNGVGRFSQRIVRQSNTALDVLKYSPLCIDYVAWAGRDQTFTTFNPNADYIVSPDGTSIQWQVNGNQPDAGAFYSIIYRYRPRYVVLDIVHHHRDSTVDGIHYQFPVQAVAKLDYLIRNESADPQQVVDASPFPSPPSP